MAVTSELTVLHRTLDDLRHVIGSVRERYGDIPAVNRLLGDVDRIDLDASELDSLSPPPSHQRHEEIMVIDDTPVDPSLWADADDEGLGGFHL
jgi:hypothetical protein